jgi:hypothetical protein
MAMSVLGRLLIRASADHVSLRTGDARWIWATRDLPEAVPLRFVASREFERGSASTGQAIARIFADRRYVLRINDTLIGSAEQKPGDPLRSYDVSRFLRPGRNRIWIEAWNPSGAGGILFWLDPGDGRPVVSNSSWKIESESEGGRNGLAVEWGRPPMYPWGYPR